MNISADHDLGLRPCGSALRPFTVTDLDRLRAYGRRDEGFEALAERALRLRLLDAAGCMPDDVDVWRGARRAEASALVGLAMMRATDPLQLDLRKRVLVGACEFRDDNLGVMLAAGMAADAEMFARRRPPSRAAGPGRGRA